MRVVFLRDARVEVRRAKFWFVDRDPSSPERFQAVLDEAVRTLEAFPESGASYLAGTRRLLLEPFPYSLVYRIETNRVRVIAVPHAKQSAYWRER